MKRVLIIKMTSMGDIIHTFPALTDACKLYPNIKFDWLVEESFQQCPTWHPHVDKVIPVAFRRWRKQPFHALFSTELLIKLKQLRQHRYHAVIDAQGLLKSTILTALARGQRCGYDGNSAKEAWVNFIYQRKIAVAKDNHAVERCRHLFAGALGYAKPATPPDYGLMAPQCQHKAQKPYWLFVPNTSWASKQWPEHYWHQLARLVLDAGFSIRIPWATEMEKQRALKLGALSPAVLVLPKKSLSELVVEMINAKGVVALDTGLTHIAAAFSVPTVSLYSATDPNRTGALGDNQKRLTAKFPCAPCFQRHCNHPQRFDFSPPCFKALTPTMVWQAMQSLLQGKNFNKMMIQNRETVSS